MLRRMSKINVVSLMFRASAASMSFRQSASESPVADPVESLSRTAVREVLPRKIDQTRSIIAWPIPRTMIAASAGVTSSG